MPRFRRFIGVMMSLNEKTDDGARFMLTVRTQSALLATTGVILIALAGLYVETFNMAPATMPGYPGDAFFPRAVLIYSAIWAVVILVRGFLSARRSAPAPGEPAVLAVHWLELVSILVLVLLYAGLVERIGFEITTFGFMLALLLPRLIAVPGRAPAGAAMQAVALSAGAMLLMYAGLGVALKIGLPLAFLPVYLF